MISVKSNVYFRRIWRRGVRGEIKIRMYVRNDCKGRSALQVGHVRAYKCGCRLMPNEQQEGCMKAIRWG